MQAKRKQQINKKMTVT